jgi:hypothetical protein
MLFTRNIESKQLAQPSEDIVRKLSIVCDTRAMAVLEKLLGPATIVTENGGAESSLYYRLKPVGSANGIELARFAAKLELAHELAAKIAGITPSNGKPRRIVSENPDAELDINTALQTLWRAAKSGGDSDMGPGLQGEPAEAGDGQLTHDKVMASMFLSGLDPTATRFTFQTFDDNKDRKSKALARVLHGTLDECFAELTRLNNLGAGIFITINETNLLGRSAKNIVRPRALFYDADGDEQVTHATTVIEAHDAIPSMTVNSGGGRHGYYICDDIPLDQFSALQRSLALKLGTDRNVHDLPRVMRLPGMLHLKNPANPRLVKLVRTDAIKRWQLSDLIDKLGLYTTEPAPQPKNETIKIAEAFKGLNPQRLGQGVEPLPPVPLQPVLDECGWLRHVHETKGADQDELLWRDALRVCMFLVDGKELIHEFSNKHPDYNVDATEAKYDEAYQYKVANDFGYPQCQTICDHGSEHCKSCPHLAKGKSPLNLASQQQRDEDEEIVAKWNERHAHVLAGGKSAVLQEFKTPEGYTDFKLLSSASFHEWNVEHKTFRVVGKKLEVELETKIWMRHPKRRKYQDIGFFPGRDMPDYYNLWRGFAVEPRKGDCSKFLAHVYENVCQSDDALYAWVMAWFADIFQHPAVKCGTSLALRGKMGVGKTKIGEVMVGMLGAHYKIVADPPLRDRPVQQPHDIAADAARRRGLLGGR